MIVISQPVNSGSRIGSAEPLRVHIMVVVNHFLLGALIISELARVPEHVQNCFIQSFVVPGGSSIVGMCV